VSVEIVQFEPWHIHWLTLQPEQSHMTVYFTSEYAIWLRNAGPCYSAFDGVNVVGCAGIMAFWPGRALTWALLSSAVPQHALVIHRTVLKVIAAYPAKRIELLVDPTFPRAVAWAERLGFHFESRMPYYSPLGTTQDMYVRIKREGRD
jgi:hypothetical protein